MSLTSPISHAPQIKTLKGSLSIEGDELVLTRGDRQFVISVHSEYKQNLHDLLSGMASGKANIAAVDPEFVQALNEELELNGFLAESDVGSGLAGRDALLAVEDYTNELLYRSLYKNIFWQNIQSASADAFPIDVAYGFVIENYHFLYRESWFDSPALCYPACHDVQLLMNKFYLEEYGHDDLLLKSLNSIGISRADLQDTIPLMETLALCNSLAYWASYDPLFFFATLGVLEGKDVSEDSFLTACDRLKLPDDFIRPIRAHSDINLKGGHGRLSREIFKHIPFVTADDLQRMRRQTAVFVELYDSFYAAVWNYYSASNPLLRRVSEV